MMIIIILLVINLLIIEKLYKKQNNLYKKHLKNKEINFDLFWKEHDNIDKLLIILWWISFVYIFLILILLFI
jgi:exopolysaccharide biosynthesis predicted pyruvyltransferase EpsI